jgi:arylsulfate sulfotransferase
MINSYLCAKTRYVKNFHPNINYLNSYHIIMRKSNAFLVLALCITVLLFNSCSTYYDLDAPTPVVVVPKPTGEFLVAPAGYRDPNAGMLAIYDKNGNTMKQIETGSTTMDFKKWVLKDGKVRYSYLKYDKNVYHMPNVGYNAGQIIILDQDLKEINSLTLIPNAERTATDNNALDGHDFILLSDNHYISMAYFEKAVNNIPAELGAKENCKVVAPIIQEVENGKVIWEWDGTNEPELYKTSVEGNNYQSNLTQDFAHLNSMFIDPKDNNMVLSFRNMNQVLKIDRKSGQIIWRLGGKNSDFPMTSEQKFLRQHDAHFLEDGKTLIMFDNGDLAERPFTRIAEYTLDEKTKRITKYKSMYLPDRSFSRYMGSVMKTDSSYFIGCGADPRVIEMNHSTGEKMFEQQLTLPSYRAYRY